MNFVINIFKILYYKSMIPLLKVHEYYRVENVVTNERLEGVVNNERLEKRIVNNNRLEKLEDINYSLRRNRYGFPLSNEKAQ